MDGIQLKLVSALEKVFMNKAPSARTDTAPLTGFMNETLSFQAAFTAQKPEYSRKYVRMRVESPIASRIRLRKVVHVPVHMATLPGADDNYLSTEPGLYPDLLQDLGQYDLRLYFGQWRAVWLDVEPDASLQPGAYPIDVILEGEQGQTLARAQTTVTFLGARLPDQTLIHTKWLHTDCIAEYYRVPVFSEDYWRITENFIKSAVRRGINMILTPTHTPPLDTRVGKERLTVQLVDVHLEGGTYRFGFDKLRRWVDMCRRAGVEYYEIAHLFTQWGAGFAPKIMATTGGVYRRLFGWDTPATGAAYTAFLAQYLPALTGELAALGIADRAYFHISDEPHKDHIDAYLAAKAAVAPYLEGFVIMDALSDIDFYKAGAVAKPIPAIDHIEPFIDAKVPGLWTYYCISQYIDVSNMFMAMPSARNRILGVQLYKFAIEGFLQWGFNYYNAQYSDYAIDPYAVTDADGFTPSGDAFQVYPGPDGVPEESLRMMVTAQALYDLRALNMLESLTDRAFTLALIEDGLPEPIGFKRYPHTSEYLLTLRRRVNEEIMKRV